MYKAKRNEVEEEYKDDGFDDDNYEDDDVADESPT